MYHDPLHIPTTQYTVYHYGEPKYILNKRLLDHQNCWRNVPEIIAAHELKLVIYDLMHETNNIQELRSLAADIQEIEFHLQRLWNFPEDVRYHRFWETPKCKCPTFDNMDAYPYQQYFSGTCVLHGSRLNE
jgi:hypothetical protein